MIWLCVTPERDIKTRRLMVALAAGLPKARIILGDPPAGTDPFVVWGQDWLALRIIPRAVRDRRPFWHIDNGFHLPARGSAHGYYRMTYRSMSPILLAHPPQLRRGLDVAMRSWQSAGGHVVLALPGSAFGRAVGINVAAWIGAIQARLQGATHRRVVVRPKEASHALARDLAGAWALVTHSSNVAVDAVIAGIPVFVEPTSPAAPVGRLDLDIENPIYPDREQWWRSLMAQQFTLAEMADGRARDFMAHIVAQVDNQESKQWPLRSVAPLSAK